MGVESCQLFSNLTGATKICLSHSSSCFLGSFQAVETLLKLELPSRVSARLRNLLYCKCGCGIDQVLVAESDQLEHPVADTMADLQLGAV